MEHKEMTREEYENSLLEIEKLIVKDPAKDSEEGKKLDLLAKEVVEYEREHFKEWF